MPDKRGLIDDVQAKAVADFGAEVRRRFGKPIACTDSRNGWLEPGVLEIAFGRAKKITRVVLEEEIAKGQHILKHAIEVLSDGKWKTIKEGQSIGRERIDALRTADRRRKGAASRRAGQCEPEHQRHDGLRSVGF